MFVDSAHLLKIYALTRTLLSETSLQQPRNIGALDETCIKRLIYTCNTLFLSE